MEVLEELNDLTQEKSDSNSPVLSPFGLINILPPVPQTSISVSVGFMGVHQVVNFVTMTHSICTLQYMYKNIMSLLSKLSMIT